MFSLHQTPGRTALVNEKEYLFFSGYSYLGINHVPDFISLLQEGINRFGAVFPSSRISNTVLGLYSNTESYLSDLTQKSDTILFQSGFTAGKAAIETLEKDTAIYQSPFCHPAIRINNNSSLTFTDWANQTVQIINSNQSLKTPVILSDSLNQLTADLFDFSFLENIQQKVICIIDDSHGIGLLGKSGQGISYLLPNNKNIEYIITYSLSKALNIQAGAISCSIKSRADKIRKTSWYTAVTPPSPAMLFAFNQAKDLYSLQLSKLSLQKKQFQNMLVDHKEIKYHKDLPVYILPEALDEDYFSERGIIISSFAYPDPSGKKINRAVINALHTQEDYEILTNSL